MKTAAKAVVDRTIPFKHGADTPKPNCVEALGFSLCQGIVNFWSVVAQFAGDIPLRHGIASHVENCGRNDGPYRSMGDRVLERVALEQLTCCDDEESPKEDG